MTESKDPYYITSTCVSIAREIKSKSKWNGKMISNFKQSSLATVFFLALVHGASAQNSPTVNSWGTTETLAQTVTRWGLIGTWAADCSVPADENHDRQTYKIDTSGRVFHAHNLGNKTVQYEIVSAAISELGSLGIQEDLAGHHREFGYIKQSDGSIKVMYNRNEQNEYSVKEGIIIGNGKPTIMQNRCN